MVYIFNMHRRKFKALYSRFNSAINVGLSVIKHKNPGLVYWPWMHRGESHTLKSHAAILHDVGLTPPVAILKPTPPPWSHPLNPKQICAQFWIHIGLI